MEAHAGMVRCGYCRQTFDARPSFETEQPNPQLELPMQVPEPPILDIPVSPPPPTLSVLQPMTLAERVEIVEDEDEPEHHQAKRQWPWTVAVLLAMALLVAQAAYFFRVDIAAHQPSLKPALVAYCKLLDCDVPLPQYAELITIEASELEAVPGHDDRIVLSVLLRNRAVYAQAYPNLELTLTDDQDKAVARRVFRPADYLSSPENPADGIKPDREKEIRLRLGTDDLRPMGYRLALFYPR
jgi:hypothetical protein